MSAGERAMLDRLNVRYGKFGLNGIRYARAEHVRLDAGFETRRTADYFALDLYPGGWGEDAGPKLHGHEVKVSRSDWLNEVRDPSKAEAFARYCDFWWLVVHDKSIVKPGEMPPGWGLMVAYGRTLRVITQAERRVDAETMPRNLQATFSRAVLKTTLRLDATEDPAVKFVRSRLKIQAGQGA